MLMIKDYTKRLSSPVPSLFAKIFGIFKVSIGSSSPTLLILMENLSNNFGNPLIFDLKGSVNERKSTSIHYADLSSMPRDMIYKDLDFVKFVRYIELSDEVADDIFSSLELDLELLENYEIMDYSMLLLIEEPEEGSDGLMNSFRYFKYEEYVGCIGIIDYLQCYSARKKLEATINVLRTRQTKDYSCVPPDTYKSRFIDMIQIVFSRCNFKANN